MAYQPDHYGPNGSSEKQQAHTSYHEHHEEHGVEYLADDDKIEYDLHVTEDDLLEAKDIANRLTLEEVREILSRIFKVHEMDPNFPFAIIKKIELFLNNDDIFEHPEKYEQLIWELKIETALITGNSPYAEVRAVVDKHDDASMTCSTIRSWTIGMLFTILLAFTNQMFEQRMPKITLGANIAQMLAYPVAKIWDYLMPDIGFTLWGVRHSLNPGPFNKKEHMLITIMANVAFNTPYTNFIIWTQWLPQFYNQSWAGSVGYQTLMALSTNFIGYGLAGICRRFLVYPSHCVWPSSLVTIALNSAFHSEKNTSVLGPFKKVFRMSRMKLFSIAFVAMFVYNWFPNFLFAALSSFSWISWIAPENKHLVAVTSFSSGVGLNPLPTFDWNVLSFDGTDPLQIPFYSTFNKFIGTFLSMFVVLGMWYGNAFDTAYLPMNDPHSYDNKGGVYNVSNAIDDRGIFDSEKYEKYSPPFLTAGAVMVYMAFFAIYSACLTYGALYHRHEIKLGFRSLINSFRKNKDAEEDRHLDVHNRHMMKYAEVPEWWYSIVLILAMGLGIAGICAYPTYTTPGVVFYGVFLCLLFVVPVGIIKSITGIEVTLNVLAEFIGGSIVEGNGLAMNYFKTFGFVTCAHAVLFSNDLKLAHYLKIPPRQTFTAQIIATLVSTFICIGVLNFQMYNIPGICTEDAPFKLTCPGTTGFFTATIFWGTIGPRKMWGANAMYSLTLLAFPFGVLTVLVFYYLARRFPNAQWMRQVHPVAIFYGANVWAPYNMSYVWPTVPIAWLSWMYVKTRWLGFWSKYNFVLSAAFSCGIAICGLIMFFCVQWQGVEPPAWWGNTVGQSGCEAEFCTLKTIDVENGEYIGPRIGTFH